MAWSLEPLDFSDFVPPQSTAAPPAPPPTEDYAEVVLLSLPQAVSAAKASTDTKATDTLPMPTEFTVVAPLVVSYRQNPLRETYSAWVDTAQTMG